MKKILPVLSIIVLVWGCAKKMTPARSETPTTNTGTVASNNSSTPTTTSNPNTANTGAVAGPSSPTDTRAKVVAKPGSGNDAAAIAGQATFNAKCNRCHGLKITSDYTAERWASILVIMATRANLTETEKANVYAYVKENAKK